MFNERAAKEGSREVDVLIGTISHYSLPDPGHGQSGRDDPFTAGVPDTTCNSDTGECNTTGRAHPGILHTSYRTVAIRWPEDTNGPQPAFPSQKFGWNTPLKATASRLNLISRSFTPSLMTEEHKTMMNLPTRQ